MADDHGPTKAIADIAKSQTVESVKQAFATTGDFVKEGLWEGLFTVGISKGWDVVARYFTGGKDPKPKDVEAAQKIVELAKAGNAREAFTTLQSHFFSSLSRADEQIYIEAGLAALAHKAVTTAEFDQLNQTLIDVGRRIRTNFREAFTQQTDPKKRVNNLVQLAKLSPDQQRKAIEASGMADPSLFQSMMDEISKFNRGLIPFNKALAAGLRNDVNQLANNWARLQGGLFGNLPGMGLLRQSGSLLQQTLGDIWVKRILMIALVVIVVILILKKA